MPQRTDQMGGPIQTIAGNLLWAPWPIAVSRREFPFALQPQPSTGVNATGNPFVLAGSGAGTVTFQFPINCVIQIDQWLATSSNVTVSSQPGGPLGFTCQVYYGNRNFQLTQSPTPGELIFGRAGLPGRWGLQPWIVNTAEARASGVLMIDCTNTLTTTNTIWFALMGKQRLFQHAANAPG